MFEYLDLVNIMVYDFTGGWKSSKVAQHASMEHFRMAAKRWSEIRGVPKEKDYPRSAFLRCTLRIRRNPVGATHMPYKEILTNYPNEQATEKDEIGLLFYNGKPTMRAKAGYVNDNGYGGIMIWAISHDSPNKRRVCFRCSMTLSPNIKHPLAEAIFRRPVSLKERI